MTNEELDEVRAEEAWRLHSGGPHRTAELCRTAARLAREGWTPPEPVDPNSDIWIKHSGRTVLCAADLYLWKNVTHYCEIPQPEDAA